MDGIEPGLAVLIGFLICVFCAMIQKLRPYELQYKDGIASCRVLGRQADEAVLLNMLGLADQLAEAMKNS